MSDKLQEIKSQFKWGKENLGTGIDNIEDRDVTYLILQLEQAQEQSRKWEKAFDNSDRQYLKQEKQSGDLRRALEQAQAELKRIDTNYQDACDEIANLDETNQKLIEALGTVKNAVIESKGQIWTGVSICNIVDQALQEAQQGTSKD